MRQASYAMANSSSPLRESSSARLVLLFNLKAAVEREKAVQANDVHREWKNCVVTFWVMSQLFHFLGASRGCADFRDPTAVLRFNEAYSLRP
jgi:hypothetical protein